MLGGSTVPTYAYACTACAHHFEAHQSFTESSLSVCPECSGRLRKVFQSVGVVFKGSGFYRNDSRSSRGGKGAANSTFANHESGSDSGAASHESSSAGSNDSGTPAKTPAPAATKSDASGPAKVGASSAAS
jgi:putative FmdB family regulatory protein